MSLSRLPNFDAYTWTIRVLVYSGRFSSCSTARGTSYRKCPYAPPNCDSPARGIMNALLGDFVDYRDPVPDLLDEAGYVFGFERKIGCIVTCGHGSYKQPKDGLFWIKEIMQSSKHFRPATGHEDNADDPKLYEYRKSHISLAKRYLSGVLGVMQGDKQISRLQRLALRFLFPSRRRDNTGKLLGIIFLLMSFPRALLNLNSF